MTSTAEQLRGRLAAELPALARKHQVPGVSVAVWVDGEQIEAATGVINSRTGVPVTPDALFMIQSITKIWTATAVLQLVDDGLVELDEPVRRFLPGLTTADPAASAEITVRQLLTHTGGFEGDLWSPTTDGPDALQRFVEDLVPTSDQHSRPGETFSYCNAGYGVLGRLVEVLRGTSYEQALRRFLLAPLGVAEVAFDADQALAWRTAIGHVRHTPDAAPTPTPVWAVMPRSNPAAGNQLAMSARNLLALGRLHLAEGLAPDGRRVLSAEAVRAMRTPQVQHPASLGTDSWHGLGWFLPGRGGLVEHGGDTIGVASALQTVPHRDVAVAVLTNADNGQSLISELLPPLLADLAGVPPAPEPAVPSATWRTAEPECFVGRYETRVSRHDLTRDAGGSLWMEQTWLREGAAMAELAGVPEEVTRTELRLDPDLASGPGEGEVFVLIDDAENAVGKVAFLGRDEAGRARFLHTGRAVPRASDSERAPS